MAHYGVYGMIDQMVWRLQETTQKRALGFSRVCPQSIRSQPGIDFYTDAGVNFMGLGTRGPTICLGQRLAYRPDFALA